MKSRGFVDGIENNSIRGWAATELDNGEFVRCIVSLAADDTVLEKVKASVFRSDLLQAGIKPGYFGFLIKFPQDFEAHHGRFVQVRTGDGTILPGCRILARNGRFYESNIDTAHDEFLDHFKYISLEQIIANARYVHKVRGKTAAIYYMYGVILNRKPEPSIIISAAESELHIRERVYQMVNSEEYSSVR